MAIAIGTRVITIKDYDEAGTGLIGIVVGYISYMKEYSVDFGEDLGFTHCCDELMNDTGYYIGENYLKPLTQIIRDKSQR
tara:strand:- start:352 stop:591 length:240 start_codon:yes stop_codon:yes gene_type:complete